MTIATTTTANLSNLHPSARERFNAANAATISAGLLASDIPTTLIANSWRRGRLFSYGGAASEPHIWENLRAR